MPPCSHWSMSAGDEEPTGSAGASPERAGHLHVLLLGRSAQTLVQTGPAQRVGQRATAEGLLVIAPAVIPPAVAASVLSTAAVGAAALLRSPAAGPRRVHRSGIVV